MSRPSQSAIRLRSTTLLITVAVICLSIGIRALTRPSSAMTYGGGAMALSLPIAQDFDSIGTSATATLPVDFRADRPSTVRTVGSFAAAGTVTTQTGGANLPTNASNGIYNFGSGTTAIGTDRAIGFLSSGTATQSGNLYAQIVNNTGNLPGLLISYDVEKYRNGSNPVGFRIQLYYSTDGTTWTSAGDDFLTSFAADANNNGFMNAPGVTVSVSNKTLNAPIPNGGIFYLAWNYSVVSGSTTTNAQALAIDNIFIQGATGSTNPSGVGAANPNTVAPGGSTLLTVVTTPGTNPTSSGITVTGDLTAIGGSAAQAFFDDGSNGDVTPNDGVFSLQATVSSGTAPGAKSLPFTVSDAQGRTSLPAAIALTVQSITPTPTPNPLAGTVVISQVYGGGGNTGATLKNDFIEIINHTDTAVNLSGWCVQYCSTTDQIWQVTPLTDFMLQPGRYYLIKEAPGAGGTVDLPTPDATGSILMGAGSGKVALVSGATPLTGNCPTDAAIIDFVGYGTANCFEGSGAAPTLTNTTAALRGLNGCLDTNNNAADFVAGTPTPRNSSSPTNNCAILSGVGSANPNSVATGESTTLTVQVFPAPNPPSTGISVVADLSSIGGSPTQSFSGAGNIFTFNATIPSGVTGGTKSLPVTITDDQARSFTTNILLNILSPHVVISQVYGGGGNSGATFTNDFVELFNPTNETVTLTGWSLQYASAAGTSWTNKQPIGGIIGPSQYFLVALASGANGMPLPVAPNISGDINMSATTGKIALVRNSTTLSGGCPIGDP